MPPSVRGRYLWLAGLVCAYTLPAAIVWSSLGFALGATGGSTPAALAALAYAAFWGWVELSRISIQPPGLNGGVKSTWVVNRHPAAQLAIWGAALGPGLVTYNPYAGMWLIPLLLALTGDPATGLAVGALVGLAHGLGRAAGVAHNIRDIRRACEGASMRALEAAPRWRLVDGAVLLGVAACLAVSLAL